MFQRIEKEYKRNSFERKFDKLYWLIAISIAALVYFLSKCFNIPIIIQIIIPFVLFSIIILIYLVIDYKKVTKQMKQKSPKNLRDKIDLYVNYKHHEDIKNLTKILSDYNYKTKDDLKIAIDYFTNRKSIKVESSIFGWVISVALTLSSFAELAYNDVTKKIDYDKLLAIINSILGFVIYFLIGAAIVKFIMYVIVNNELHSQFVDDLMTIYLNFDEYKNKFTEK